jgi:branched-chain amino acid transport system permease protein
MRKAINWRPLSTIVFHPALPRLGGLTVGIGLLVLVGLLMEDLSMVSTITTIFMFIMLAQGWNILGGYGGYMNLGMAAFLGVGAYTSALLASRLGFPGFVTVPLAGVVTVVFALIVGVPSLRLRGPYFVILTLIIGFLTQSLVLNLSFTGGGNGIYLSPLPFDGRSIEQIFYFIFLVLMILTVLVVYFVEHSKFGYALVAIREDEDPAEVLGVRTTALKIRALLIGAFIAGIAGGIYAFRLGYIEPQGLFSLDTSIDVVLMTLVGGLGTWQGPVIGVPLVLLTAQALRTGITQLSLFGSNIPNEFNRVVFGLLLILMALYAKDGVMGLFRKMRGRRFTV